MTTAFAEGEDFGRDLAQACKVAIANAVAPLKAENADLKERIAALEARPVPEKGDDGRPGEKGVDGRDGTDGENGADGRGVRELLIDREGCLVATMDDGVLKNLGPVVGKDGKRGKDGRDGFSLEDFDCRVLEDDRTIEFSFKSGDHEHIATLKWPTAIDRGVWKEGETYERGDAVTWAGSLWIAQEETAEKPDSGKGFRLAVKRGRDGKDRPMKSGEGAK